MAVIAAGSLAALALVADRLIHLALTRERHAELDALLEENAASPARLARALAPLRGDSAALWRAGLAALPAGRAAVDHAMRAEGLRRLARVERGLSPLGALITLLPMLGFLGTILGLIRAFMQWERLGANIQVASLAGGMYEAMLTTAAGLCAAIPYYLIYTLLSGRAAARARRLEVAHELFLQRFAPDSPAAGVEIPGAAAEEEAPESRSSEDLG